MKAIVIGRHAGEIPGIQIVELRSVTFPARSADCVPVLRDIFADAKSAKAAVLFQNTPGQVAVALSYIKSNYPYLPAIGVVISVPGPRPGKVSETFEFNHLYSSDGSNETAAEIAARAVLFANPKASTTLDYSTVTLTVTVDGPPMPFQFSHIEWLDWYFYAWYDNGSGYWEADPKGFPIRACSPEEALAVVGANGCGYGACITANAHHDPNTDPDAILAGGHIAIIG